MAIIEIKQVRSVINSTETQKKIVVALGLGKINRVVKLEDTPVNMGMVKKIQHLVTIS